MLPDPGSYRPTNYPYKKIKPVPKAYAEKLPGSRFFTDAPGPGTYRMQTEFGVYSTSDVMNHLDS